MVICLEWGADLHMAQLMPLPLTVSCFSKIQIGFTFLVPAHPGSLGQRAVKRVCVCVCVCGVMNVYQLSSSGKQLYHAWSRINPPSNFVTGTSRQCGLFTVCRRPHSQEGDWARPRLCKSARHGPWPARKRYTRDHVWRERSKPVETSRYVKK